MVKYLSKFVLEVLPSLVATIVGAYIVAHYINPRPEAPKAAVVATVPAGEASATADTTGTVEDKAAVKSLDAKSADVKAKDEAKAKPTKIEEKKSAVELARAAIERLRGTTVDAPAPAAQPVHAPAETARADESARVAVQTPLQRTQVAAPAPTPAVPLPQPAPVAATAPPPLPPPVIIASPYGRHSVGPEGPATATPADRPADQANADRPTPPADIPVQRDGFDLQPQPTPVEHVSIADHVLSTTKSFFRALTPSSRADFSQSNFSQSN